MKVKRWRQKVVDRVEWGPYRRKSRLSEGRRAKE